MNKRKFGKIGEKIAEEYLLKNRYKIICKNFYTRRGEIDIIAQKEKFIYFIEVKTRSNFRYGTPASAVNLTKLRHMKTTAKIFLSLNKYKGYSIRFDIIEVIFKDGKCMINHIKQII
jgi:putative endonuclease